MIFGNGDFHEHKTNGCWCCGSFFSGWCHGSFVWDMDRYPDPGTRAFQKLKPLPVGGDFGCVPGSTISLLWR